MIAEIVNTAFRNLVHTTAYIVVTKTKVTM